ncbi:MAG: LysE family translocator [Spirochaetes bacterium]|nr:LysE family translocator [Spirochaetota bacterium]
MFLEIFLIALLAGISPGPDFFIVTRNSLGFGKKAGIASAAGIAAALLIHASYSIFGLTVIMNNYRLLFTIIQLSGACYLAYLGITAIISLFRKTKNTSSPEEKQMQVKSISKAFTNGFLCNILNPKAYIFFLSIFSQFMSPSTPVWIEWMYGLEVVAVIGLWFVVLSLIISSAVFKKAYLKMSKWIEGFFGAVLIFFALKIGKSAISGS